MDTCKLYRFSLIEKNRFVDERSIRESINKQFISGFRFEVINHTKIQLDERKIDAFSRKLMYTINLLKKKCRLDVFDKCDGYLFFPE